MIRNEIGGGMNTKADLEEQNLISFLLNSKKEMELALNSDTEEEDSTSDDSYSSSSWSDGDSSLEEMEERLHEFAHVGSTPALAAILFDTEKLGRRFPRTAMHKYDDDSSSASSGHLSIASEKFLTKTELFDSLNQFEIRRSSSDVFVQKATYTSGEVVEGETSEMNDASVKKPDTRLHEILDELDIVAPDPSPQMLEDFFVEMGPENYAAHDLQIADAVRRGDLETVKAHVASGKTLQCCNKFKESVVHITCRRGHEFVLKYMLEETNVSICIKDDIGRTPLHDAAWTSHPNFDMVKMMLTDSPDLLYIKDNRGFSPLSYVGKNNFQKWCDFLDANKDVLAPRKLTCAKE